MNIIELLTRKSHEQKQIIQKQRDEINNLKGEQGKPDIKSSKNKADDFSSEKERKTAEAGEEKDKEGFKLDRVVKCKVTPEQLPDDAEHKGYKPKVVQAVIIKSDNVLFEREIYWSRSQKKTYLGEIPAGYEGEFGPNINSQIIVFKYVNNMSIPKIKDSYDSIDTVISQSYISTRLTKKLDIFHAEKSALYEASLNVCDWQQIDDTGSRVNGINHYTHIVCNDLHTAFFTTPKKNRLTILDILRNFESRSYVFNDETFDLLKRLNVSQKLINRTQEVTKLDKELSEKDIEEILAVLFPNPEKGKTSRTRISLQLER